MAWAIDGLVAGFAAYGEAMYVSPLREHAGRENSIESPPTTRSRSVARDPVQRRDTASPKRAQTAKWVVYLERRGRDWN